MSEFSNYLEAKLDVATHTTGVIDGDARGEPSDTLHRLRVRDDSRGRLLVHAPVDKDALARLHDA